MSVADEISSWVRFFLAGWGLPFTLYAIAQLFALIRLKGQARMWVAAPIPLMAWVLYSALAAYAQQSNLWPILMILMSPVAFIYMLLVAIAAANRTRAKGRSENSGAI